MAILERVDSFTRERILGLRGPRLAANMAELPDLMRDQDHMMIMEILRAN